MTDPEQPAAGERAPARFPVVGIGASAGGLEALERLVQRLSRDHTAFVVLQHLGAGQSMLPEILARSSALPVVPVASLEEGVRIEPNHVYVVAAALDVSLDNGVLRATPLGEHVPRLPIDAMFRSFAAALGELAIGVPSGSRSDGTLGPRGVTEAGSRHPTKSSPRYTSSRLLRDCSSSAPR